MATIHLPSNNMHLLGAVHKMKLQRIQEWGVLENEWRLVCHRVINVHRTSSWPSCWETVKMMLLEISLRKLRLITYHHRAEIKMISCMFKREIWMD